jgi:hypothetical protein
MEFLSFSLSLSAPPAIPKKKRNRKFGEPLRSSSKKNNSSDSDGAGVFIKS